MDTTEQVEDTEPDSLYAAVGGMPFFTRLVDAFYDRVERDAVLLAVYPDPEDLGPARVRLRLFLAQYWGGPTTYSRNRPCGIEKPCW